MKIAFVDIETTGLDPDTHEIIDIGAVIYDNETAVVEEFSVKVRPHNLKHADPEALALNGYSDVEWKEAVELDVALRNLASLCQGAYFLAYNATFDWAFLHSAFKRRRIEVPFHHHRLCVMSMAWYKIPRGKVKSYSLKTVCVYLGIAPEPKIHRALAGAQKAFEVYIKLLD